jgi:putative transposase
MALPECRSTWRAVQLAVSISSSPDGTSMWCPVADPSWALRDWCRLSGTRTSYIEPGSPWENPYIESFNGRVRDELLNIEEFSGLTVVQVVVEAWRIEYNTYRLHSALGGLTPAEYAATWTRSTHPQL